MWATIYWLCSCKSLDEKFSSFLFSAKERVTEKMYEAKTILDGLEDAKSGNIDGDTAISNIRSKYGI